MSILPNDIAVLKEELEINSSKNTALQIIEEYLSFFHQKDFHQQLWLLTISALTNDELEQSEKGRDRYNHIFFYEYTKLFFDAVHAIYAENETPKDQIDKLSQLIKFQAVLKENNYVLVPTRTADGLKTDYRGRKSKAPCPPKGVT